MQEIPILQHHWIQTGRRHQYVEDRPAKVLLALMKDPMARDPDLAGLPNWPRLLTRAQASLYLGLTVNGFNLGLKDGTWPDPITYGRSKLWDRRRLDEAVDMLSGYVIEAHGRDVEEEDRKQRRDAWRAHRRRAE